MTPREFIILATKLADDPASGPPAHRSAVSRAYYCAFLSVLDLMQRGLHVSVKWDNRSEHKVVQMFLTGSQVPEAVELGYWLGNLHDKRKSADYDMDDLDPEDQAESQLCVARANEIMRRLRECSTTEMKQRIFAGISQFRRINRISTS